MDVAIFFNVGLQIIAIYGESLLGASIFSRSSRRKTSSFILGLQIFPHKSKGFDTDKLSSERTESLILRAFSKSMFCPTSIGRKSRASANRPSQIISDKRKYAVSTVLGSAVLLY